MYNIPYGVVGAGVVVVLVVVVVVGMSSSYHVMWNPFRAICSSVVKITLSCVLLV